MGGGRRGRRRRPGDGRHLDLLHRRVGRAHLPGREGRGRVAAAGHALLQQAAPVRPGRPLLGHRRLHRPALHALQHPRADRLRHRGADHGPAVRAAGQRGRGQGRGRRHGRGQPPAPRDRRPAGAVLGRRQEPPAAARRRRGRRGQRGRPPGRAGPPGTGAGLRERRHRHRPAAAPGEPGAVRGPVRHVQPDPAQGVHEPARPARRAAAPAAGRRHARPGRVRPRPRWPGSLGARQPP